MIADPEERPLPADGLADRLEKAPRVRRLVAAGIDVGIASVPLLFTSSLPSWLSIFSGSWPLANAMHFAPALYLLLRDSFDGRSIGKLVAGLQVIETNEGRPANMVDSVVRNGILGVAALPWVGPPVAVIWGSIAGTQILLGARRRYGEGFAATRVIRVRGGRPGPDTLRAPEAEP